MLGLRVSKPGFILAGVFLGFALALQLWLLYSAATNPADSGEAGLLLFAFTLPWAMLLPDALVNSAWMDALGPALAWGMIALNAFLLYCLAGGLRRRKPVG